MPVSADCFLFDTTNYYTYLSSKTQSDLAVRRHNKDGKHQKNLLFRELGEQQVLAYRSTGQYWGKSRALIVTYNPKTYRKKKIDFQQKLNRLTGELLIYRRNYREQRPHWKDEEAIRQRYHRLCEDLHIGSQYYEITFESGKMSFRQNQYQIKIAMNRFGKNIIVTDNKDWSTEEIYLAYHERSKIERQFRKSKSPFSISVTPQYHWTDSKIRLHILTCVVAMVYFSIFRNKLRMAGITLSAEDVLKELRNLRTALYMTKGNKKT